MTLRTLLRAALAAVLLPAPAALAAQGPPPPPAVGVTAGTAADSALRITLLTMGPGDAVWERFGHNALRVQDPSTGLDLAYNYGMFDFGQENFFRNFAKGRMEYWMDGFDGTLTVDHYRGQNRSVWEQELDLDAAQKRWIADFLAWNARPENRSYRYDYYRDNCSTRVRDVVDLALGGALRAATEGEASGTSYRWHTARLTGERAGADAAIFTGLMGGLGPAADRPISRWEEMFLPMKLRDGVAALRVRGADGTERPVVLRQTTLFEARRPPSREAPPAWWPGYLVAGLALGGVLAGLGRAAARRATAARVGYALVSFGWTAFAGIGGVVLLCLWLFTDHAIAHANENLLHLSPLALPLIAMAPLAAFGKARRAAAALGLVVAALSVLGLLLGWLPWFPQDAAPIAALAVPANLALAWSLRTLAAAAPATPAATA